MPHLHFLKLYYRELYHKCIHCLPGGEASIVVLAGSVVSYILDLFSGKVFRLNIRF